MFPCSNKVDLELLREMGVSPSTASSQAKARLRLGDAIRHHANIEGKRRPSLKVVGQAVVAIARMKKMADEWKKQKVVREEIGRKMESLMAGKRKRASARY